MRAGYIIAISSVLAISGGFLATTLQHYLHWNIPWIILSVILTGGAVLMTIRGVGVSTKLAGFFFGFEMLVLIIVSIAALIKNGGHLSLIPFEPSHITKGFSGLAAGFPLAIYFFIGWENSAALAEETGNPRRNVPRAVFLSAALMVVSYVLFSYATVSGFGYNVAQDQQPEHPAVHNPGPGHPRQLRVLRLPGRPHLDAGRPDLGDQQPGPADLQRRPRGPAAELDRPRPPRAEDPGQRALTCLPAPPALIILVWALLHLIGGPQNSGSMNPETFFVESSTMGTILILVVYFLANLALPFYYRRYLPRPVQRRQARHPAGPRHDRDRRARVLPGQAGPGGPVQLVPLPRARDRGPRGRLRLDPQPPRPDPRRTGGLDHRGRMNRSYLEMTDSAIKLAHPLDPATGAEYLAGRQILAAAGLLAESVRFAYYGLEEPPKHDVLGRAPRPTGACGRS